MTNQELKITIHNLVNETEDPEILRSIYVLLHKLLSADEDDDIVGYETDGTPVTTDMLVHSIVEADEDIEKGNGISHLDMKAKYGAR